MKTAEALSYIRTNSTAHMSREEREAGIEVMLSDLHRLATEDGCIAAAWALEFVEHAAPGRALTDIAAERERQRAQWGDEHDDQHTDGQLAELAALVAHPNELDVDPDDDGEDDDGVEWVAVRIRRRKGRRRQLVIAGALIVAELERLDRAEVARG